MARLIDASEVLSRVLQDTGLTQEEFGLAGGNKDLRVGSVSVNRWVKGRVRVDERKLMRLLRAHGIDPAAYGLTESAPLEAPQDAAPPWFTAAIDGLHAEIRSLRNEIEQMKELAG